VSAPERRERTGGAPEAEAGDDERPARDARDALAAEAGDDERPARDARDRTAATAAIARAATAGGGELLALLEDAPAAIALQRGPELRWELANAMFRSLLGGHPLVGYALAEVLPDWAQGRRLAEAVMRTGEPYLGRAQRFLLNRGGGALVEGWLDIICRPLHDPAGAVVGVITVAVDVSEQVDARHDAERLALELQQAVQARDQFLSVASHELRTPVTALSLQLESLARAVRRDPSLPPAQIVERVTAAGKQVARLVELLETLLDVTRLQQARLDLVREELDLAALARAVVERERPAAAQLGSSLTLEAEAARGAWDRSRVDQILTNLLSNAIKYGAGRPIVVRVAGSDERATLAVSDAGLGIAPADQARIFDRFERAVSRTHYSGLGLGLWISRQLAEAMGGTLTVESAPGVGSTFTLALPRSAAG
jgi:signal transduction histidine kinase